jgi:uncharacterized DUF497 family protein
VLFEWDETKRRTLVAQRQVDLLYAALIFEGDVLSWPDERRKYGERGRSRSGWWKAMSSSWCTRSAGTSHG